jgi:hypothetical protein
MRIVWDDATLSVDDIAEVKAWTEANDWPSILTVTVRHDDIVLHMRSGRSSFATRRHFNSLTHALEDALASSAYTHQRATP